MKGTIVSFRLGLRRQYPNQVILEIEGIKSFREASKLIGRKVVVVEGKGRRVIGKITKVHGKKGRVIARFRKPLPGQVLGTPVEIL